MNWHAVRVDDYTPPVARGMRRINQTEQARTRILDDDELRKVWKAAEGNGNFGALVRLLLLTAQRRRKVVTMRWDDLSKDGRRGRSQRPREKGNAGELVLPDLAIEISARSRASATTPTFSPAVVTGRSIPFRPKGLASTPS